MVPTFEQLGAKIGVNADGYKTTPLSGQPDIIGGFTPEIDAVLQAGVSSTYRDFLVRVARSRKMTVAKVDTMAQGRVWDGGAARQMGLVDQFGGLDDALAWAAAKAGLKDGGWHPVFLGDEGENFDPLIRQLLTSDARAPAAMTGGDPFALVARRQNEVAARLLQDAERLMGTSGVQAYCLECPSRPPVTAGAVRAPANGMAALVRLLMAD